MAHARGRDLARAACYDCHSNETDWPLYSGVAPMSWLVRYDVERGRKALNFSPWGTRTQDAGEAAETVEDGSMPPDRYVRLHPHAKLSDEERQALIAALEAMDEGGGGNSGPGAVATAAAGTGTAVPGTAETTPGTTAARGAEADPALPQAEKVTMVIVPPTNSTPLSPNSRPSASRRRPGRRT